MNLSRGKVHTALTLNILPNLITQAATMPQFQLRVMLLLSQSMELRTEVMKMKKMK